MSFLAPLLEMQTIDVAADAARLRSAELPEREAIPRIQARLAEIDSAVAACRAERAERASEEERLGREVAQLARDIEAAEVERYSGKRKNQDEAAAHDEAQQRRREKQSELEEREMELLEEIESLERRSEELETARAATRAEGEKLADAMRKVEAEVSAELDRLGTEREGFCRQLPKAVIVAYERVRAQPQKGGRGAATLADGRCGGCRIKLPSLENSRMLAEPEDAVIQCPQCRRVLVR